MSRLFLLVASAVVLVGCAAPPTRYAWGSYEELIYSNYALPGKLTPQSQVDFMQKDFEEARAANKPVPPGWHAQLAYLYYQIGKTDQARQELLNERVTYPESAVLMDRLLANLRKKP